MNIQAPRGTQDLLPQDSAAWVALEAACREAARRNAFDEVRTPVFEHTELFLRGVGDTSDIVQKEMYTFADRSDRSLTLKPESTASVVRALGQSGLLHGALPLRVFYCYSPHFRYEKPQAGRLREHHQFGIEVFGAADPSADAQVIGLGWDLLNGLGLQSLALHINSIGCPECRAVHAAALRAYLAGKREHLCELCRDRAERNPMRVLDCKSPVCQAQLTDAPLVLDHLCGPCREHFEGVQGHLTAIGIPFEIDGKIVRGLDYYTRTVFEIIAPLGGSPITVIGGGRYDGLCCELGAPDLPALGFGMGQERLFLLCSEQGVLPAPAPAPRVFVAHVAPECAGAAFALSAALRRAGVSAVNEQTGRSLKAQMKYADKAGFSHVLVLGPDELAAGTATLRDMRDRSETAVSLSDFCWVGEIKP